jgi:hypothetical protein
MQNLETSPWQKSWAILISFERYIIYFIPISRLEVIAKIVHEKSRNPEIRINYIQNCS